MAADEFDNSNKPDRPSWETAAPSARPSAPRPAAPQPIAPPAAYTPPPSVTSAYSEQSYPEQSYSEQSYPEQSYSEQSYSEQSYSEPVSDPNVRYDLAGNPIVGSAPAPSHSPQAPAAPFGYSGAPGASAPGVWPPPPSTAYGGAWSAGENGTVRVARLKWNWGAFLLPLWWSYYNGQRGLAAVILMTNLGDRYVPAPYGYIFMVAHFGIMIYLGLMGHRLAWSSERFMGDYDNFIRTQRAWMIWGFAIVALSSVVLVLVFTLIPGAFHTFLGTSHSSGSNSTSGQ